MSVKNALRLLGPRFGVLAAALTALSLSGGTARAVDVDQFDVENARELYMLCNVGENDELYAEATLLCFGYFTGAIHYHRAVIGPDMPPIICAPEGTTTRNVVDAFVAYAAANSGDAEIMDGPPLRAAMQAAIDTWPCE